MMTGALNAQAPPFAPRPTYPNSYPGARNVTTTPENFTPALTRSDSTTTRTTCTLESEQIRNLWERDEPGKPLEAPRVDQHSPAVDNLPIYHDNSAIAVWIMSAGGDPFVAPEPPTEECLQEEVLRTDGPRSDVFIDGSSVEPYIPFVLRKRAIADPQNCSLGHDIPWLQNRPWIEFLRKGCSQQGHSGRRRYANYLAFQGPWDAKSISELAGKFCERAADDAGPIPSYNALFARQVYERFQAMGPLPASLFENLIMQAVFAEFRTYWVPTASSSIMNLPTCSPSPPHAPPIHHLSCALGIAFYLGDLFRLGLVKASIIDFCLRQVVDNMMTLEQLQAAHAIITHCDSRLYTAIPLLTLFGRLEEFAARIINDASAVGAQFDQAYVQLYVQDIRDTIHRWAVQPPTEKMLENPTFSTMSQPSSLTRMHCPYPLPLPTSYISTEPFQNQNNAPPVHPQLSFDNNYPVPGPPPVPSVSDHSPVALYPRKFWGLDGLQ